MNYELRTMNYSGKNKPKTNPNRTLPLPFVRGANLALSVVEGSIVSLPAPLGVDLAAQLAYISARQNHF